MCSRLRDKLEDFGEVCDLDDPRKCSKDEDCSAVKGCKVCRKVGSLPTKRCQPRCVEGNKMLINHGVSKKKAGWMALYSLEKLVAQDIQEIMAQ